MGDGVMGDGVIGDGVVGDGVAWVWRVFDLCGVGHICMYEHVHGEGVHTYVTCAALVQPPPDHPAAAMLSQSICEAPGAM